MNWFDSGIKPGSPIERGQIMSGRETIGLCKSPFSTFSSGIRSGNQRLRQAILAAAILGCAPLSTGVFAGTITTSATAPTGSSVQISQPDNTGANPSSYRDFTDNYAGPGQVFTPLTNFSMTSFTFEGGGGAGTYNGGTLAGAWTIYVGELNNGNYYGATITPLDTETADGTPIATDVSNGATTNYDTVTLSTPIPLNANKLYYWAIQSPSGSYYQLAGTPTASGTYNQNTTSTEYPGGESMDLDNANNPPTDFIQLQNADRTFFISGSVAVSTQPQWSFNGNGTWLTGSNWSTGSAPQFQGDTATFGNYNNAITVSPVVTLTAAVTVDSITFSAPSSPTGGYNISNGGLGSIRTESITVLSGNHSINVPLVVKDYSDNNATYVVDPGASLTLTGLSDAVGYYHNVSVTGGGTLSVNNLNNAALDLEGTTLTMLASTTPSTGIYAGIFNGATWNINNSVTVEQYYDNPSSFLNLGIGGTLITDGGNGAYVSAPISGAGSLSVGGGTNPVSGSVAVLTGANTNYSGGITVSNGYVLEIGNQYTPAADAMLGNASLTNTITLNNGIFAPYSSISGLHAFVIGSGGGTFNTGGYSIGIGSVSGSGTLSVNGGGVVTIAAQSVPANSSGGIRALTLGGLTINTGGVILGAASLQANRTVLVTGGLSLSGSVSAWTSTLDLANNDMIVQNGSLTAITNQVHQGYANGTWQGSGGILSTAAAANTSHLTALGVIQNSVDGTASGTVLHATFDGVSSSNTDVLVKYTYYGDANLDGKVDGSDYSRIDSTYVSENFVHGTPTNPISGWFNGDFNYDGVVNGSDYTLIDNAFNSQGAQLSSAIATAQIAGAGGSAVPEPASLGLLGLGAVGLLGRKKSVRHR